MKADELADAIGRIDPVYIQEAKDVWDEADKWRGRQKKTLRRRRYQSMLPIAACLVLAVTAIYGINNMGNTMSGEQMADMESAAERTGAAEDAQSIAEGAYEESAEDMPDTDIVIHEVTELWSAVACGAAPARTESYTAKGLEEYYGMTLIPEELPEGLALLAADEAQYQIGYDADDQVIEDNCKLLFTGEDETRRLSVAVRTVELGEMISFAEELQPSVLLGREVTIGHYMEGTDGAAAVDGYLAIFEKGGATVTVQGAGLTDEEFLAVLKQLV